ncbi:MAG: hypothetical protein SFZ03_07490 [Candidatus Melainabacteria bacterium]|nr:hypothetical protein [Candidatus Melainabacteria bacterium]
MTLLDSYQTTQPIPWQLFRAGLQAGCLSHAYLFQGQDLSKMYQFALDLAKILNCQASPEPTDACGQCRNCLWIQDNAHPAVMTVSRLTWLSPEDTGKKRTRITTHQIRDLLAQLSHRSEARRVVIFTDSEERGPQEAVSVLPPFEWRQAPGQDGKSLHLLPLSRSVFSRESVNRLLKTLEEPNPNTLFIFLTDTAENVLDTVVSRCQVISFAHPLKEEGVLPAQESLLTGFLEALRVPASRRDPYQIQELFESQVLEPLGVTPEQALLLIQQYLRQRHVQKPPDLKSFRVYARWQKQLSQTRRMIMDAVRPDLATVALWQWL